MVQFFGWYDNQSDPHLRPYWEGAGWVEADTAEEAAQKTKADGCRWTQVCVTASTDYPTDATILAGA
jgi:hypothetical protein